MYDEVDHFMAGKDEISLDNEPPQRKQKGKQSITSFDDDDVDYKHLMKIDADTYSSGDDSDVSDEDDDLRVPDDSDDDEENERARKANKQSRKLDEKYSEWGRLEGKHKYYGDDLPSDEETYETGKEKEEEARMLQKQAMESLQAGDFGLQDDQEVSDDSEDEYWDEAQQKESFRKAAKAIENVSIDPVRNPARERVERVKPNLSKMSEKEKLQLVQNESPELVALLTDFKAKLQDLKTNVQPLLTEVVKKNLPTSEGISLLETKFHLLLNYCMNVGFYMLLKAEGKPVQEHPVITQLVKLRLLLEKLSPVDQKLRYQVQKLLKLATDGQDATPDDEALSHRPNIDSLEEGQMEQDDLDEQLNPSGVYKLKKIAPVSYDDPDKKKKPARRIKSNSAVASFVQEEFGDAPVEINYSGKPQLTEQAKVEIDFEEDHFMRLGKIAKQRKQQEKNILQRSQLEDPLDFRDLTSFGDLSDDDGHGERRTRLSSIMKPSDLLKAPASAEADIPYASYERRLPNKRRFDQIQPQDDGDDDDDGDGFGAPSDDEDEVMEDDYYEQIKQAKKKRKLDDTELHSRPAPSYRMDELDPDSKRGLTFEIESNRGLTRHRPKKMRNPRKRYRLKAEAAEKKLKTMSRGTREKSAFYSGEATGIKKSVKRSVNLK